MRVIKVKRSLIAIVTLVTFMFTNYSSVFAAMSITSEQENQLLTNFKEEYLQLESTFEKLDEVVAADTVSDNAENNSEQAMDTNVLNDTPIGEVKLLITSSKYQLTKEEIKQYSIIDGNNLVIPTFDENNIFDKSYLLFIPSNNISKVQVTNHNGNIVTYTHNFEQDKKYLLATEINTEGNIFISDTEVDGYKTVQKEIRKDYDSLTKDSITNIQTIVDENSITMTWNENESIQKPSYTLYSKVMFTENNTSKMQGSTISNVNGKYTINFVKENIPKGYNEGKIFTIDNYGRIINADFGFQYNAPSLIDISGTLNGQAIDVNSTDQLTLIDNGNLVLNIDAKNVVNYQYKNSMPTQNVDKNTLYYSIKVDGVEKQFAINASAIENGNGTRLSLDLVANAAVRSQVAILPGDYEVKFVAIGEYPSDQKEATVKFKVISDRPIFSVDKEDIQNGTLRMKADDDRKFRVSISNNNTDLDINNDLTSLNFNLRLPQDDCVEVFCAIITYENNDKLHNYHIHGNSGDYRNCPDTDFTFDDNLEFNLTGNFSVKINELKTKLGYTEHDIRYTSAQEDSYRVIFDNDDPMTKLVLLDNNNNVLGDYNTESIINNDVSLGLQISDFDFNYVDVLDSIIVKKSNNVVENAKFNKVSNGLYKLVVAEDGLYSITGRVSDNSGNESNELDVRDIQVEKTDISEDGFSVKPYDVTKVNNTEVYTELPIAATSYYNYKDDFRLKITAPKRVSGYSSVEIIVTPKVTVFENYTLNPNPNSNLLDYKISLTNQELKDLNKDGVIEKDINKFFGLSNDEFKALAATTNNEFDLKVTVKAKNNDTKAVIKKITVDYDEKAPEIKVDAPVDAINDGVDANHYIVNLEEGKSNLNLTIKEGITNEVVTDKFQISYDEKNLKMFSLNIINNENTVIINEINSQNLDSLNKSISLENDKWYKVYLELVDFNNNKTVVNYKITIDSIDPEFMFVALDATKVNGEEAFNLGSLNKFEFEQYHKIDTSKLLGVLVSDLDIKEGSEKLNFIINNSNKTEVKLVEQKLTYDKYGEYKLYLVDASDVNCIDGKYTINVAIEDIAGNTNVIEGRFTLDDNLPQINLGFNRTEAYPSYVLDGSQPIVGTQGDFNVISTLGRTESGYESIQYKVEVVGNADVNWQSAKESVEWVDGEESIAIAKQIPIAQYFSTALANDLDKELELKLTITVTSLSKQVTTRVVTVWYDKTAPRVEAKTTDNVVLSNNKNEPTIFNNNKAVMFTIKDNSFVHFNDLDIKDDYNTFKIEEAQMLSKEAFNLLDNTKKPYEEIAKFSNIDGLQLKQVADRNAREAGYVYNFVNANGDVYDFAEGIYKLKVKVIDIAGNETIKEYFFIVEKDVPIITNLTVNELNGDVPYVHNGVNYVNKGLQIKFDINEVLSGNKALNVKLSSSDTEINKLLEGHVLVSENNKHLLMTKGQYVYNINLNEILGGDAKKIINADIKVDISLDTRSNKHQGLDSIIVLFDEENDNVIFNASTYDSHEYSPVTNNQIFANSKSFKLTYDSNSIVRDTINVNETTNDVENSVRLDSIQRKILGDTEFKDIKEEVKLAKLPLSDDTNAVEFTLSDVNGAKYNFTDGIYKMTVTMFDACGNKTTNDIEFIVDTKNVDVTTNGLVNKFENGVLKSVPMDISEGIDYTATGATVNVEFDNFISGFAQGSQIIVTKEGSDDNVFEALSSNLVGVENSGAVVSNDTVLEKRSFNLTIPNNSANSADTIYYVTIELASKAKLNLTEYKFTIVCDYTNPQLKLDVVGYTGENGDIYYSNASTHQIKYTATENNLVNVEVTGADEEKVFEKVDSGIIPSDLLNEENGNTPYVVKFIATDKVGRSGTATTKVVYDVTKPNVTTMNSSNFNLVEGTYYTNQVRPYNYTVTDPNLKTERLAVNNSVISKGASISGDGEKTVTIEAEDYAGNKVIASDYEFKFTLDTVKPELKQEGIVHEKHYNKDVKANITYTDTHLDKASYVATLNGNAYANEQVVSKHGEYELKYSVKDYAGNMSEQSVNFVVDKIAPVITISGIKEEAVNGGIVKPIIEVDDPTATITSLLNGEEYIGEPIEGYDKYTLLVIASDKAGNVSKKAVTFMMDSRKPIITVEDLAEGDVVKPGFVPTVLADKEKTNIKLLLNGVEYDGKPINEEGDYTLEIIAVDELGNETVEKIKFTVKEEVVATSGNSIGSVNSSTFMYVGGGILLIVIIGGVVIATRRKKSS